MTPGRRCGSDFGEVRVREVDIRFRPPGDHIPGVGGWLRQNQGDP
jgi:hypothetical protein